MADAELWGDPVFACPRGNAIGICGMYGFTGRAERKRNWDSRDFRFYTCGRKSAAGYLLKQDLQFCPTRICGEFQILHLPGEPQLGYVGFPILQ